MGSTTLANVLGMIKYGGAVAACGLAGGMDLPASVAPFILRGVTLAGVNSVMAPKAARVEAWARLERDLDRAKLADMTVTRPAADVVALAPEILAGKVRGRIVLERAEWAARGAVCACVGPKVEVLVAALAVPSAARVSTHVIGKGTLTANLTAGLLSAAAALCIVLLLTSP